MLPPRAPGVESENNRVWGIIQGRIQPLLGEYPNFIHEGKKRCERMQKLPVSAPGVTPPPFHFFSVVEGLGGGGGGCNCGKRGQVLGMGISK